MSKEIWNERYAAKEYIYGKDPNGFFREQLTLLTPGKLLLPAEGEGRNAVFAAQLGWEVVAFDQSETARSKAMALSHERGVTFSYELFDVDSASFPEGTFDVVALIFVHLTSDVRIRFHQKAASWLKSGGRILVEAYSKDQLKYLSGGPKTEELLYAVDDLRSDFMLLNLEYCEQVIVHHEEGTYHRGDGSVIRVVATKP
jgi:SAM-dependent methyltransferase